ncbi:unnamed protein product [Acanthoscelides obtectus]|uniref:Uncharacterized protein n=1 Tax=Acanthoscelides obtectus TaxID=200917 RepID=A0A9P0M009_ACAOB|nr:unnamed protein product [Acanthoscelides obtectus]CAK1680556.1 hypothetical protein AOBTE_LOCUS32756 [Acanthoscelides obtectus]
MKKFAIKKELDLLLKMKHRLKWMILHLKRKNLATLRRALKSRELFSPRERTEQRQNQPCLVVPRVVPNALIKPPKLSNPQPSKSIPIKMNVTTLEIL